MPASYSDVSRSINGWLVDWQLQETSGEVAIAGNRAVSLGRNVVINGTFDADTDWSKGTGWTIAGGVASCDGSQVGATDLQQSALEAGKTYQLTYTILNYSAGNLQPIVGGTFGTSQNSDGTFTETLTAGSVIFRLRGDVNFIGDVDNVIIQQTDVLASSSYPGPELLDQSGTGVMDAGNWSIVNSATLTNPATNVLQIAYNGSANPGAEQGVLTIGKRYVITGDFRGDGTYLPRITQSGAIIISGTTSTTWQAFDLEFTATAGQYRPISNASAAGYAEFRNLSVSEANPLNADHTSVTVGVAGNGRGIRYAAEYDGTNSYTDIYSAELNTIFDPTLFTINIWFKVSGAGFWTDGTTRFALGLFTDGSNRINFRSPTGNNTFQMDYTAGGTAKSAIITTSIVDWAMMTLTVDLGNDEMIAYMNGVQQGAIITGLGTWVGALAAASCAIGAVNNSGTSPWDGKISPVTIYDQAISQSDVTTLWQAGK
jgi:hypothetical protein